MVTVPRKVHTFGSRFSQDIRGIFVNPKEAVKTIIAETDLAHALSVPIAVVVVAALMGVFGKYVWTDVYQTIIGGPVWYQAIVSIIRGFLLLIELVVMPIVFVVMWIFWSIVFHFLGSIVAGADITKGGTFNKTMKLTGFVYAPLFLNVLPFFPLITGYWSAWIAYIAMRENYRTSNTGAFIVILPYLFTAAYGTLMYVLRVFS